ncbi:response regulator [Brasilonema bromeliae]|uniref:DNA-binding response regulator n=1 Tax=Brasilonema bromeliae SPC951 TaxID=385972 RepID=A0ABX1PFG0_9CYAN|nr:response regulator transcription factor [Brasilonema bromeliae]NMG22142.1 DNA-binding response regulator [Brasilonema bromeliae SPC951]
MSRHKILVIEDETALLEALRYNLEREGFEVLTATDGLSGLQRAQSVLPDLIVLDLMLPVLEGLEVCRRLRDDANTRTIPIVMVTARGEEIDEVVGFQMGADDYVAKPFKVRPLLQRVKALLRRTNVREDQTASIAEQGVEIDRWRHRATLDGRVLPLTPTEFRLLWSLARQPGRAFSRHELMDASMGEDVASLDRTIDVHVKSLRQKLGDRAELIETVRGVGYRFKEASASN